MTWLRGRKLVENMYVTSELHGQTRRQASVAFNASNHYIPSIRMYGEIQISAICQLMFLEFRGRWGLDINGNKI